MARSLDVSGLVERNPITRLSIKHLALPGRRSVILPGSLHTLHIEFYIQEPLDINTLTRLGCLENLKLRNVRFSGTWNADQQLQPSSQEPTGSAQVRLLELIECSRLQECVSLLSPDPNEVSLLRVQPSEAKEFLDKVRNIRSLNLVLKDQEFLCSDIAKSLRRHSQSLRRLYLDGFTRDPVTMSQEIKMKIKRSQWIEIARGMKQLRYLALRPLCPQTESEPSTLGVSQLNSPVNNLRSLIASAAF